MRTPLPPHFPQSCLIPLILQMLLSLRTLHSSHHLSTILNTKTDCHLLTTAFSKPSSRHFLGDYTISHHDLRWSGRWGRRVEAYYLESMGWEGREGEWRGWTVPGVGGSVGVCRH